MSRSLSPRPASANVFQPLDRSLSLYSLAAATAGVSVLALAQPADASVIVTKTNIQIHLGAPVSIDINNDGINDFRFSQSYAGYVPSLAGSLAIAPLTGGELVCAARGPLAPYASALVKGANVGPSAHFSSSVARGQITIERTFLDFSRYPYPFKSYFGKWQKAGSDHYLGVKFLIHGATHYGWIRLTVNNSDTGAPSTISEYAYETVANQKIGAGDTADASDPAVSNQAAERDTGRTGPSLGLLAVGADALASWRH